jgi:hypothetical protein
MNTPRRIVYLLLLFTPLFLTIMRPIHAEEKPSPVTKLDYGIITGEWRRTDGGYLIKISNVQADAQAKVEYFNPSPIHIAQAAISTQKELIRLFIKFQDKGYEGSTYSLFYYAEKDALVGFYYQAIMDKTFEVIFVRKNN